MKLKMLFSGIMAALIFTFAGFSVNAATVGTSANYNFVKQQKQTWHFKTKAAAEKKLKELQSQNHTATMFKNLRGWSVTTLGVDETRNGNSGGNSSRQTNKTTAVGAGCEKLLRTATVVYYPSKSLAQDMYNAHLKQGDCARLSYDSKRGEWALAVKAVPGAGSRRGTVKTTTNPTTKTRKTTTKTNSSEIPKGANITYFPERSTAEAIQSGFAARRLGENVVRRKQRMGGGD